MTLLLYKGSFYRLAVERRAEFFKLVESMDYLACKMFLEAYAERA